MVVPNTFLPLSTAKKAPGTAEFSKSKSLCETLPYYSAVLCRKN